MSELVVELYGQRLGALLGERDQFDFVFDIAAIKHFGLRSRILSFAIPLRLSEDRQGRASRRNFFEEVLAEGSARKRLAKNANLDDDNTMGLLARYGRDVAGALQIWDPTDAAEPRTGSLRQVSDTEVRQALRDVRIAPLGNATARRMSSLAGVQDKIVLVQTADGWAEPLDGFPSTHIIKPVVPELPSLIFDEEYGARIARHLGLSNFSTQVQVFDGASALVIERFDRDDSGERIHQEDFNQALGVRGDGKYEENGHPGLRAIAKLLTKNTAKGTTDRLLRMLVLSVAVGNLDMHAKNVSVVHLPDGTAQLAPMYDVVPQMHQPFDKKMAFSVNGKFAHSEISLSDLVAEGSTWGVRRAEVIVWETLDKIAEFVQREKPVAGAHFALADDIMRFVSTLRDGEAFSTDRIPANSAPVTDGTEYPTAPGGWGGPVRR